jgi:hypothetical protein
MGGNIPLPKYYIDFTSGWYIEVGNAICIFVFSSAFLANLSYFFFYFVAVILRACDRRWRSL